MLEAKFSPDSTQTLALPVDRTRFISRRICRMDKGARNLLPLDRRLKSPGLHQSSANQNFLEEACAERLPSSSSLLRLPFCCIHRGVGKGYQCVAVDGVFGVNRNPNTRRTRKHCSPVRPTNGSSKAALKLLFATSSTSRTIGGLQAPGQRTRHRRAGRAYRQDAIAASCGWSLVAGKDRLPGGRKDRSRS